MLNYRFQSHFEICIFKTLLFFSFFVIYIYIICRKIKYTFLSFWKMTSFILPIRLWVSVIFFIIYYTEQIINFLYLIGLDVCNTLLTHLLVAISVCLQSIISNKKQEERTTQFKSSDTNTVSSVYLMLLKLSLPMVGLLVLFGLSRCID